MKESQNNRNLIRWEINKKCNFHCIYCDIWEHDDENSKIPVDITKLKKGLDHLQGVWQIDITGGEPFLEKNFIEICQALTEKHLISINTNLSTSNIFNFAEIVPPKKCLYIHASIHIAEREKKDKGLKSFLEKIVFLQNKGFYPTAVYVSHPDLFNRMKSDIAYLESNGVERVRIQIFRGWHNEKIYPQSFTDDQRAFLTSLNANYPEFEVLNREHFDFFRHFCYAGQRFFVMNRNGNIRRCTNVDNNYGNLFEQSIRFDEKLKPCPQTSYLCPHECLAYSLDKKPGIISRMKGSILDKLSRHQNNHYK